MSQTTTLVAAPPPTRGAPRRHRQFAPYLLIAPAMSGIGLFMVVPALLSLVGSFFVIPLAPGARWQWVGLDNYRSVFGDPAVRQALLNTVLYGLLTIVPSLAIGLGLALLTHGLARGRTVVRMALFLPMTANLVAMAVVFRWIFGPQGGFANQLLGYLGVAPINWLNDPHYSLLSVAVVAVWRGSSLTMLIFLAGLTTIPGSIHEAALAEGIRGWAKLRHITLPMMRPTTVFAAAITILTSIQAFDQINIMTQGGPEGSSEVAMSITYKIGFGYFQLGRAAALSFVLIVVLILVGLLRRRAFAGERR